MTETELFDAFVKTVPSLWLTRMEKRGITTDEDLQEYVRKWLSSGGFSCDFKKFKESHA